VPPGKDNLTPAEVAQLIGLSVHTLSYWRQTDQGPKTIKAGTRTLYRRKDVDQWLAEVDGRSEGVGSQSSGGPANTLPEPPAPAKPAEIPSNVVSLFGRQTS
jgi:predicted DNA-binding transcriptional regulator AlpA